LEGIKQRRRQNNSIKECPPHVDDDPMTYCRASVGSLLQALYAFDEMQWWKYRVRFSGILMNKRAPLVNLSTLCHRHFIQSLLLRAFVSAWEAETHFKKLMNYYSNEKRIFFSYHLMLWVVYKTFYAKKSSPLYGSALNHRTRRWRSKVSDYTRVSYELLVERFNIWFFFKYNSYKFCKTAENF
jgi:hypothetical protein